MKVITKTRLICAVLTVLLATAVLAQEVKWKNWNWEVFNIRFKIPDFVKPTTFKDTKKFSATDNKSFTVSIYPWNNADEEPQVSAKKSYDGFSAVKDKEVIAEYAVNITDFQGYMIVGKGMNIQYNYPQYFAIFGLYEPKSKLNLLVTFGWWDDAEKNDYFRDICDKIAESVQIMK